MHLRSNLPNSSNQSTQTKKKGNDEIQFIVDEDYDEHDVHVSVDEAAEMVDEQDTSNQSQYLQTYSKLNEKLREKLTPIFNRKHYSSLPQASINYFESRSRKNSYNYSAYIKLGNKMTQKYTLRAKSL